jgi:hypothetical protein
MSDRLDQLLDELDPPPLSAGFGDTVMARIAAADAPALPPLPRRSGRGGWSWGRRTLVGVAAFGLVGAAAATTGVFGERIVDLPVIGRVIASIAPAPKPSPAAMPRIKPAAPAIVNAPDASSPVEPIALDRPSAPIARVEVREAVRARLPDIRQRIEERREALLPPPTVAAPLIERSPERVAPLMERPAIAEQLRETRPHIRDAIVEARQDDAARVPPDRPRAADIVRTPERAEQLRQLRELRERRRVLREHRRQ